MPDWDADLRARLSGLQLTGPREAELIEDRSRGHLRFHIASLYPLLYRLEERGWLEGRWVEKPGTRRRRFYRLTREGRKVLAAQRDNWLDFVEAVARITGVKHA